MVPKSKAFWDRVEIASAVLSAAFSGVTATLTQDYKRVPASLAFACAAFVGIAKLQAKRIEEQEKADRAADTLAAAESRRQESDRFAEDLASAHGERDAIAAQVRREHVESAKKVLIELLEELKSKYFDKEHQDEKYKHRVTLFKCIDCDGSKRLTIFARAGRHSDSSSFWLVDDNDPAKCRGIAGEIWFHGSGRFLTAACDWPTDDDPVAKATYAASLRISVDEAEALRIQSRSFAGVGIVANGQNWGVLLLDSLKVDVLKDAAREKRLVDEYARRSSRLIAGLSL